MSPRRLAAGLLAAATLTTIAGCSSSGSAPTSAVTASSPTPLTASAYRLQLHSVSTQENHAQHQVQAAFHAKTVGQIRSALSAFAGDQSNVAQRLDGLVPPADAASANAALATAFKDNATAIQAVIARLAHTTSVPRALHIIQSDKTAQRVGGEIDAALKRLKHLGYTSGS